MKSRPLKIVAINGSPKGINSGTNQYFEFVKKLHPQHEYKTFNVAVKYQFYDKHPEKMDEIIEEIRDADCIFWVFPLYYALVHGNLKRFIEILFERKLHDVFQGKYAVSLSTSIYFYDHTAHNYIQAISEDLGMQFIAQGSFHMRDIFQEKGRANLTSFADYVFDALKNKRVVPRKNLPISYETVSFESQHPQPSEFVDFGSKKVSIVVDDLDIPDNLTKMVEYLSHVIKGDLSVVHISDTHMKGGCRGCMRCGYKFECFYQDLDDYHSFVETYVRGADIIIFASSIKDRYLTSQFKHFFDRFFYRNHTPSLIDKYIGFVFSGPYHSINDLHDLMESFGMMHHATSVGYVADDILAIEDSTTLTNQLLGLVQNLKSASDLGWKYDNFLHLGGEKVFRDEMYAGLSMTFPQDHRAYRKLGIYKTLPHRSRKMRLISAIMRLLIKMKWFRTGMYKMFDEGGMSRPLRKIVDEFPERNS